MAEPLQYISLALYVFALVALFTYGMNCYFLMVCYRLKRSQSLQQHDAVIEHFYRNYPVDRWPKVTIQLPIFNERYVVERLIKSICRFDYPKALLEIQILDDSTDDTVDIAKLLVNQMKAVAVV